MKVYLAGKVAKGDENGQIVDWREEYINKLSFFKNVEVMRPDNPGLDESKLFEVFGYNCYLIKESDIVFVNAERKLGIGTAQEMIIAKHFGKYVFSILPKDTHHRRSNLRMQGIIIEDWIHPFIFSISDEIFDDIDGFINNFANINEIKIP